MMGFDYWYAALMKFLDEVRSPIGGYDTGYQPHRMIGS